MRLKEIGNVIKNARLEKKYSQKQVSDFAGIGQSSLSQIESGIKLPSINVFIKIAYMLDLYIGEFVDTPSDAIAEEDTWAYEEDLTYVDPDSADAEE